jgi:hypothetical protein
MIRNSEVKRIDHLEDLNIHGMKCFLQSLEG